ncbi:MAG: hypothetical protein EA403_10670 [Spirochaetaceae bacterium]|nr:MAG: hypothetical protein EA403_10670 [Spirochaetaceae bacterium]
MLVSMINHAMVRLRSLLVREIRAFFQARGYLEVDTPKLAPSLIPEAHLEVFATELINPDHPCVPLFLIPSPEVWHKRLLAEGSGSIFEITHCFRNGEQIGPYHNPEFTMLEYYTVDADHLDSITITEALFTHLLDALTPEIAAMPGPGGRRSEQSRNAPPARDLTVGHRHLERLLPPFTRTSVRDSVLEHTGLDLDLLTDSESLRTAVRQLGLHVEDEESWADTFNRLFVDRVEPAIATDRPLILTDYPSGIPVLASEGNDPRYRNRWELYVNGVELANCYAEETDANAVAHFFAEQTAAKRDARVPHAVDPDYPHHFGPSFPRCSGVALGVDRLLMLLAGEINMSRVILFGMSGILSVSNYR